jgi:hypothetical protein
MSAEKTSCLDMNLHDVSIHKLQASYAVETMLLSVAPLG